LVLRHGGQAIEALSHIDWIERHKEANTRGQGQHEATSLTRRARVWSSK